MPAWMRARVASCTSGDWLMTRETVFLDTLASRAMSLIVALRPGLMPVDFAAMGALGAPRLPVVFLRMRVMVAIVRKRWHPGQRCPLTIRCQRHGHGYSDAREAADTGEYCLGCLSRIDRVDTRGRAGRNEITPAQRPPTTCVAP